jgi:hypothetical protein
LNADPDITFGSLDGNAIVNSLQKAGINLFFEPDEWPGKAFLVRKRKTLVGIESDDEDDDSWTNVISRTSFETGC